MKKTFSALMILLLVAALSACTKGYERQATAGDVKMTLTASQYPLVKGDNTITIKAVDQSGKPVTDAVVNVRYYMPPMPGMAPMEFNTQAVSQGDAYAFTANIAMEGGWKAEVTVNRPGKPASSATFNLDAR